MFKTTASALALSAALLVTGLSGAANAQYTTQASYTDRSSMGGGFIEFLFSGPQASPYQQQYQVPQYEPYPQQRYQRAPMRQMQQEQIYQDELQQSYQPRSYEPRSQEAALPARPDIDPRFLKQTVQYDGREAPGTIVIHTPSKYLYLVQGDGQALRYGIGVGKPGFQWAGTKSITMKREWPSWTPPAEMLKRRPDLPRFMEGGPDNPLGARALYLGSSLYRIHGSNEPWTIGTAVSSGCIRMRNEDVIDLYQRVKVGTKVVVI